MNRAPEFPGEMTLDLRLGTDRRGGLVRLSAQGSIPASGAHEARRRRHVRDVVPVFVAAIDAGLFRGPKEGQQARVINALAALDGHQRVDEWELLTPPLDAEAIVALARMFWTVGARSVRIAEVLREKEPAIRSLDQVPSSTVRIPPWRVEQLPGDAAESATVTVGFEEPVAPDIVTGAHAVLRTWGALASLGAFTGGDGAATPAAVLHQLGEERPREVFATFETLALGPDGWGALWAGLSRIHRRAPIARVVML